MDTHAHIYLDGRQIADVVALPHGRGRGKNNKPDPHYPPPMTDHRPVRLIALASETGHATNIIAGLATGLKATVLPVAFIGIAILLSYPNQTRLIVSGPSLPEPKSISIFTRSITKSWVSGWPSE